MYHIVCYLDPLAPQQWSDEQVAERWLQAYPGRLNRPEFAQQRELKKQAIMVDKEKLIKYRKRLGSLSWFMGRLNEPLAKQSNNEDFCTGRFWEGRYSSQALLDEAAVFSAMAYVDINPVRAKITQKLEESNNTSIMRRIENQQSNENRANIDEPITPVAGLANTTQLTMPLGDYIQLVEWTGQAIVHPAKASIPVHITPILKRLNLQQNHWLKQIENYNQNYCHVVGSIKKIREKAAQLKLRCLHGIAAARNIYLEPG